MTFTPADLRAAADREADIYGQTRIPAMLRAGAAAMAECERLRAAAQAARKELRTIAGMDLMGASAVAYNAARDLERALQETPK